MLALQGRSGSYPRSLSVLHGAPSAGHNELSAIIDSGTLPELRWPNFADYQLAVKKFYDAAGYPLAWTRDGQPTGQARAMIGESHVLPMHFSSSG